MDRDEQGTTFSLSAENEVGNFRRRGDSDDEEGFCLACDDSLTLTEEDMLRHLVEKHPEAQNRSILTIHEGRGEKEDEDGDEGLDEETTVLIVAKSPDKEEGDEEIVDEEGIQSYFKESESKDMMECRLCSVVIPSSDILKHIVEVHQQVEIQDDMEEETANYIYQEESLFMDRKRAFPDEEDHQIFEEDEGEEGDFKRMRLSDAKHKDTRSLTWQFFDKVKGGDTEEVRCHICDKRYHTAGGSTTVMHRHLNKEHPEHLKEIKEDMLSDDPTKKCLKTTSRSVVWTYFIKAHSSNIVLCKLCGRQYSSTDSSTGIMLRHLRKQHVKEYKEEILRREAEEESQETSRPTALPAKKPPRKTQSSRSSAWTYFTRIGPSSVKCNICSKDYSNIGGSTSAMIRHLRKSHKDISIDDHMSTPSSSKMKSTIDLEGEDGKKDESLVDDDSSVFTVVVKSSQEPVMEKSAMSNDVDKFSVSERILLEGIALEGKDFIYSDVQIICREGQVIRTHKLILASTSLFMYELLKNIPETEEDVIISAPDFSGDQLKDFLDRIYIGGDTLTEGMLEIVNNFQFKMDFIDYPNRKMFSSESMKVYGQVDCQIVDIPDVNVDDTLLYDSKSLNVNNSGVIPVQITSLGTVINDGNEEFSLNREVTVKIEDTSMQVHDHTNAFAAHPKRKSAIWNYFLPTANCKESSSCIECKRVVGCKQRSTSSMIKHLQRHHEDLFKKFCLENSKTSSLIKTPVMTKTITIDPEKAILDKTCSICFKVFSTKNKMLIHHKAVHLRIKAYTCDICGKSYSRVDSLKDHVASTHSLDVPSFLCKYCGKTFKRRATRFRHERFHRNDRRHQCSFCPKKFFTSQTLRNHERTHTGEKPYECHECSRRFTMQHQLTTHLRVHTGDKPYRCAYCNEAFKHSSSKNKHICLYMPREEAHSISAGINKRKPLSSALGPSMLEETTEVILPITTTEMVNDGGDITTTYHTVVKDSVLKDISQHIDLTENS
uniref:Zinc finger protein 845like [Acyrthosiphon pisum] n=1 Tax=Lepeophtheirus salmonis TaxID=72036 RepID=A0A0K2URD2_LEPSM